MQKFIEIAFFSRRQSRMLPQEFLKELFRISLGFSEKSSIIT